MSQDNQAYEIVDNPQQERFETEIDGSVAYVTYHKESDTIRFDHTLVPDELAGRGLGGKLARHVLDQATAQGLKVIPKCAFIAGYIQKHPEYQPLVASE